jgi:hypothetical protein
MVMCYYLHLKKYEHILVFSGWLIIFFFWKIPSRAELESEFARNDSGASVHWSQPCWVYWEGMDCESTEVGLEPRSSIAWGHEDQSGIWDWHWAGAGVEPKISGVVMVSRAIGSELEPGSAWAILESKCVDADLETRSSKAGMGSVTVRAILESGSTRASPVLEFTGMGPDPGLLEHGPNRAWLGTL